MLEDVSHQIRDSNSNELTLFIFIPPAVTSVNNGASAIQILPLVNNPLLPTNHQNPPPQPSPSPTKVVGQVHIYIIASRSLDLDPQQRTGEVSTLICNDTIFATDVPESHRGFKKLTASIGNDQHVLGCWRYVLTLLMVQKGRLGYVWLICTSLPRQGRMEGRWAKRRYLERRR